MTIRFIRLGGVALTLSLLFITVPAGAQSSGFSSDERDALARGELVRRNIGNDPATGRVFGGVSFLHIDLPIETVWAKAKDPAALTALIPSLSTARVVQEGDGTRVVAMHHSYGVGETDYFLRMALDDEHYEMRFEVDRSRPHDVASGRGFLSLRRYRGGTFVTWGMRIEPGMGLVGELFGPMLDGWLLKPPLCLRDAVEPGREPSC